MRELAWPILVSAAAVASPRPFQGVCRPSDYVGNTVEQQLGRLTTSGDLAALLRNQGQPPQNVRPADVARIMDEALCERGRTAYAAYVRKRAPEATERVHMWHVGPFLAVLDPDYQYLRGQDDRYVMITTADWQPLGLYGFYVPDDPW